MPGFSGISRAEERCCSTKIRGASGTGSARAAFEGPVRSRLPRKLFGDIPTGVQFDHGAEGQWRQFRTPSDLVDYVARQFRAQLK